MLNRTYPKTVDRAKYVRKPSTIGHFHDTDTKNYLKPSFLYLPNTLDTMILLNFTINFMHAM